MEFFKDFRINEELGVLTWRDELDIAPETLYAVATSSPLLDWMDFKKAPSANKRRMKLGILKATKKASVPASAPNSRAMTRSRIKPKMRDTRVKPPTRARDRETEAKPANSSYLRLIPEWRA